MSIECKHLNIETKEGRQAQKALVSMLKEVRKLLLAEGIDVWCTNRYSYRAELIGDQLTFELILPKASDAEHDRAVEIIVSAFPCVTHVKRGLYYFRQLRYCESEDECMDCRCAVDGTDMRYEIFSIPFLDGYVHSAL